MPIRLLSALGAEGREFESRRPDQLNQRLSSHSELSLCVLEASAIRIYRRVPVCWVVGGLFSSQAATSRARYPADRVVCLTGAGKSFC